MSDFIEIVTHIPHALFVLVLITIDLVINLFLFIIVPVVVLYAVVVNVFGLY